MWFRPTDSRNTNRVKISMKLGFGGLFGLGALLFSGCPAFSSRTAPNILAAQTPGTVEGAGVKLTSPGNAASPTTMTAEKRTAYYAPPYREPLIRYESPYKPQEQPKMGIPAPAWIDEKVVTVIGAHQNAALLIKAAEEGEKWSKVRWLGICLVVVALGAALYYRGTPEGYPMIYLKVGAIGAALAIIDPSGWWFLLLLVPALFYLAQKLGVLKLPV